MSNSTAKLFRYFDKLSGDLALTKSLRQHWEEIPANKKGQITTWMKRVCATMTAIKTDQQARKRILAENRKSANLDVLKGFV